MDIIIEKINGLDLPISKRTIKLPKGKLLVTVGDKKFIIQNGETIKKIERVDPNDDLRLQPFPEDSE